MSHKLQGYYKITLVAKWNFIKWNFVNNFFNSPKNALGTFFRKHFTKGAPNVKFGTKWLHKIKIIYLPTMKSLINYGQLEASAQLIPYLKTSTVFSHRTRKLEL